jgi:hypothetical protein
MIQSSPHMEAMYSLEISDFEEEGFNRKVQPADTYLFLYVHCLPSFFMLIKFMINFHGFNPSNIFILPKRYSRIQSTVDRLKEIGINVIDSEFSFEVGHFDKIAGREIIAACKLVSNRILAKNSNSSSKRRLILVDDGGQLTEAWQNTVERTPLFDIVSIQQTASGMFDKKFGFGVPQINMAQSAAKRWFESKIIAAGVAQKVADLDRDLSEDFMNRCVGVAGFGAVGRSLTKTLIRSGYNVAVLDPLTRREMHEWRLSHFTDQCEFLQNVETVFGCVGRNWMELKNLKCIEHKIRFFSCSSRDIEFMTILRNSDMDCIEPPFGTARINSLHDSLLFNGGFPINFDRTKEYETLNEIIITRALILASVLQAMHVSGHYTEKPIKLSAKAQKRIVKEWLKENNGWDKMEEEFGVTYEEFESNAWWVNESQGSSLSDSRRIVAEKGHIM